MRAQPFNNRLTAHTETNLILWRVVSVEVNFLFSSIFIDLSIKFFLPLKRCNAHLIITTFFV